MSGSALRAEQRAIIVYQPEHGWQHGVTNCHIACLPAIGTARGVANLVNVNPDDSRFPNHLSA